MSQLLVFNLEDYVLDETFTMNTKYVHKSGDGRAVIIKNEGQKRTVIGAWPRHNGILFSPDNQVTINVGTPRGIDGLENDIPKRFLPDYHRTFAICKEEANQAAIDQEKSIALKKEIIEGFFGYELSDHAKHGQDISAHDHGVRRLRFSVDTIGISTGQLPIDIAKKVLNLLKEEIPKE